MKITIFLLFYSDYGFDAFKRLMNFNVLNECMMPVVMFLSVQYIKQIKVATFDSLGNKWNLFQISNLENGKSTF